MEAAKENQMRFDLTYGGCPNMSYPRPTNSTRKRAMTLSVMISAAMGFSFSICDK
jgi:hypothetical protein